MIKTNFKKNSRRVMVALLLLAFFAGFLNNATFAYGPKRATYKMKEPAPHVTFNSIVDNPVVGDERDFVRILEVGSGKGFSNEVEIKEGKTYEVYAAYHNNAASNLNESGKGIAENARIQAVMPSKVVKDVKTKISVVISAKNAIPAKVWDEAYVKAGEELKLNYVNDSATIHTKAKNKEGKSLDGHKINDIMKKSGSLLGVGVLDGKLPGCAEWAGYVTFRFTTEKVKPRETPKEISQEKPKSSRLNVVKQVSLDGEKYAESVEVKNGGELFYKIEVENIGEEDIANLRIEDIMANKIELVKLSTEAIYPDGQVVKEKDFAENIDFVVNSLPKGKKLVVKYRGEIMGLDCGENELKNIVKVKYGEKEVSDDAVVITKKECAAAPGVTSEPKAIPETGPAEIIFVTVVLIGIAGGVVYALKTRRDLKRKMQAVGVGKPVMTQPQPMSQQSMTESQPVAQPQAIVEQQSQSMVQQPVVDAQPQPQPMVQQPTVDAQPQSQPTAFQSEQTMQQPVSPENNGQNVQDSQNLS